MQKMLESGRIPMVAGCCIDLYHQKTHNDFFIAITTRVDTSNLYFVTEIYEGANGQDKTNMESLPTTKRV